MAQSSAEKSRRYRLAHPDRVKASRKAWEQNNPDKVLAKRLRRRKVYRISREKKAIKAKRYAAKHAEHLKAYHQKYQVENRERLQQQRREYWQMRGKARVRPLVQARKDWIDALKNKPCADCGHIFHPCAMDFDHVNGSKASNVSQMLFAPEAAVLAEIAKCELVCANCHRVRTFTRRRAPLDRVAS